MNVMTAPGISRRRCPFCQSKVMVVPKGAEPHLCPNCLKWFSVPTPRRIPGWVWAVVVLLIGSLRLLLP
jgi:hypothetical protein